MAMPFPHPTTNAETTARIDVVLQHLRQIDVRIPQPGGVHAYLGRYPEMAAVVQQAVDLGRATFDGDVQLSLEMYRDPEIADDHLVLFVRSHRYEPGLLPAIDRVVRGLTATATGDSRLTITTDFQLPR